MTNFTTGTRVTARTAEIRQTLKDLTGNPDTHVYVVEEVIPARDGDLVKLTEHTALFPVGDFEEIRSAPNHGAVTPAACVGCGERVYVWAAGESMCVTPCRCIPLVEGLEYLGLTPEVAATRYEMDGAAFVHGYILDVWRVAVTETLCGHSVRGRVEDGEIVTRVLSCGCQDSDAGVDGAGQVCKPREGEQGPGAAFLDYGRGEEGLRAALEHAGCSSAGTCAYVALADLRDKLLV